MAALVRIVLWLWMVELVGIEPTTSSLRIRRTELEGGGGSEREKAEKAVKVPKKRRASGAELD